MNSNLFVNSYHSTLTMCAILIVIMGITMGRAIGGLREIRYFRILNWSAMAIVLEENIWSLNYLSTIQLSMGLMKFLSLVNLIASCIGPLCFYCFSCATVSRMEILRESKVHAYLKHVPATCMVLLNIVSYWRGYTYTVDEQGYFVAGPLYLLQVLVGLGYLAATAILITYLNRKTGHAYRRELMRLVNAVLIIAIGGVGQSLIQGVPAVSICNALAMTYLNVSLLHSNVSTDVLTGLTNRSKMNSVLKEKIENAETKPFTLYVADVNSFKQINDTYGHQEGDGALKRVANAFRHLGKRHRSLFVARYGGDEFILTLDRRESVSQPQLEKELQELVDEEQSKENMDYQITMSLGGYDVNSPKITGEYAIHAADGKMYQKKKHRHGNKEGRK